MGIGHLRVVWRPHGVFVVHWEPTVAPTRVDESVMKVTMLLPTVADVITPTSDDPGAAAATTGLFTITPSFVPASMRAREYQLVGDRPTMEATTGL